MDNSVELKIKHIETIKKAFETNVELTRIIINEELLALNENINNCKKANNLNEIENNELQIKITQLTKQILQKNYQINENKNHIEVYNQRINRLQSNNLNDFDLETLWYKFLYINY